ncbi:Signal transduction histidine kinase, nitrogen specific [Desulfosporosinus lacus DSM 15449]|uniref:histidine kinase n=2 Tax=Desulfosporosinus TaxID=79206 RepID=A0A1M5WUC3_9FIRM|nr:Signal transduction histidine kinase, nitrogen specific [Desulfosporosinus lacus DSM 15449]
MVPLKLRFRSFQRQKALIFLSVLFIITIVLCDILFLPDSLHITLKFIPFIILIIWFELLFTTWGKVWVIFATIVLVVSYTNPILSSSPLLLVHITFLLVIMVLFDRKEKQERILHQRHLKTMRALLRQNPPLVQTVDYTREAVILLDDTGTILELNSQSSFLLSLPESYLVGKPIYDVLGILPNPHPSNVPENGDFTWTQKGIVKQLKFRTRPLLDHNNPSGILVTLFDISEAKKRLESELQVEKLSIVSQVSAGLAHEIRNPMTTIKGFMQLITPDQWPESFRPYQQLILDEIQTIDQLLNNFILLTNPSAPHLERLNLAEAIPSMTQAIQTLLHKQGVNLILESPSHPVYIMGDREQLLQALLSILNNAIEASPKGGNVIIRLREEESCVSVNIIDDGPGIPENLRQRILDPFFTTHKEGTGLGLTIAQQIILTHHGKLYFSDSSSSTGTEVTIDFPSLSNFTGTLSA